MVAIKTLLPELRELVTELAEDLLARSSSDAKIDAGLRDAFHQIERGGRTAQAFEVWLEDYLDQVAVAWVLACVFVRFMEDNQLIDECWLAGERERRRLAEDTHELFFREHPHDTDREYFQHVFKEVGKIPAAKDLFAEGKTPLWAVAPSGDAAMHLLKFWREIDAETGRLRREFSVFSFQFSDRTPNVERLPSQSEPGSPESDSQKRKPEEQKPKTENRKLKTENQEPDPTRFLGDLYQELSERAKKKYALLQTPVFVEEFILDRTLTPAIDEFGLEKVRMIDPTCGSGHFLLGGFARLFDLWSRREPNEIKAAQMALDGVWGVDINPFAVAIARFRLIVAAVQACGIKRLKQAPGWNIHLASGDSLLFGSKPSFGDQRTGIAQQLSLFELPAIYAIEDRKALHEILGQGYHVVVGNPPYITVKDAAQNDAYRTLYSACYRQYSLGVPFTQRFWELALHDSEDRTLGAGYVGMITANSFMKREFGKKLIEEYLPRKDLTHLVDTSGAYIPGHTTSTVILFGRNRKPVGDMFRAVLGIKGEPAEPVVPSNGHVWNSIVRQIDLAHSCDDYTSAADVLRVTFASHPWSIGGGGVGGLKEGLEASCPQTLADRVSDIGVGVVTRENDVYLVGSGVLARQGIHDSERKDQVTGDQVRDWAIFSRTGSICPYSPDTLRCNATRNTIRCLWPWKAQLAQRTAFGLTQVERGLAWFEYSMFFTERYKVPRSIVFPLVATHNHFILDRGGVVFNHSAPIIKLSAESSDDDHLSLLAVLNSSTSCFWMKQVMSCKGLGGQGGGIKPEHWHRAYEFAATQLKAMPTPVLTELDVARQQSSLALRYAACLPENAIKATRPNLDSLAESRRTAASIRGRMIALQEELDWQCYERFGLVEVDECYPDDNLPEIALGERAFEIVMARQMASGGLETTWFQLHGSKPITEIPSHWPAAYRELTERRIKVIEANKDIALIEKPEYKRRWNTEPWDEQEQRALRDWLLDRLETPKYRKGTNDNPEMNTTAQMADVASADAEFLQVAAIYRGRPDFDVATLVAELVEGEAVPFLAVLRYKPTGLRKRDVWERTWDLQRKADDYQRQRVEADAIIAKAHMRLTERLKPSHDRLTRIEEQLHELRGSFGRKWLSQKKRLALESPERTARRLIAELPQQILPQLEQLEAIACTYHSTKLDYEQTRQKLFDDDPEYQSGVKWKESIPDDPEIPVPPRYATADFIKTDFWRLRGKLDVPKERWISYPHCSTESDPTLVVGWAGWNHLEQATALVAYYDARKREGWDAKRLTPLLAGLDQLLPWIHQWHPEVDPAYGETAGQSFETVLEQDAHELGLTLDDIRRWTPPEKQRKTRTTRKKKAVPVDEEQ
jgi:hypothetical protein